MQKHSYIDLALKQYWKADENCIPSKNFLYTYASGKSKDSHQKLEKGERAEL